ncbi:hypothetical protein BSU04_22855 [Caballeronia sordidicola]|uniref:Uncharacterized protein n=1 Tax=Caballeronia sordidicola TaxID=196367 RepID=A0A226WZP1_CABSO|nr:hypothetical protein BSU04_22855 [Caballeronia sordidicola]
MRRVLGKSFGKRVRIDSKNFVERRKRKTARLDSIVAL